MHGITAQGPWQMQRGVGALCRLSVLCPVMGMASLADTNVTPVVNFARTRHRFLTQADRPLRPRAPDAADTSVRQTKLYEVLMAISFSITPNCAGVQFSAQDFVFVDVFSFPDLRSICRLVRLRHPVGSVADLLLTRDGYYCLSKDRMTRLRATSTSFVSSSFQLTTTN